MFLLLNGTIINVLTLFDTLNEYKPKNCIPEKKNLFLKKILEFCKKISQNYISTSDI